MRAHLMSTAAILPLALIPGLAHAAGAWTGGQDIYHVPLSWCAIAGSPAAANPNITPVGSSAADTNTDAVLWRRHERPTDNIYIPQAGISFRSAINNSWGTLNFPIIADPDPAVGNAGDVRGEDLSVDSTEFNAVINACDVAWTNLGPAWAGIGVTAVNVNLFVDANGDYFDGGSVATPIGWGGCVESVATGACVAPYDGRIAIADNRYLYPTVADRTWPPSPNDPAGNFQYSATDSLDQLVGHELGHALGLAHRDTNTNNLMFSQQQDNDGDGDADNTALNAAEVAQARTAAQIVPGLEIDPPNQFLPGSFVRARLPDPLGDVAVEERFLDLAAASVALDRDGGLVYLDAQLASVMPADAEPIQVWYLIDTDGRQNGAPAAFLEQIGAPATRFAGADLVIVAEVGGQRVQGRGWRVVNGDPVALDQRIVFDLARLMMHPYYPAGFEPPADRVAGVFDVVRVQLPRQLTGIALDRPFAAQVLVGRRGQQTFDRLGADDDFGRPFVLQTPSFPHCYVSGDALPGETVKLRLEGLRPNRGIHGLLGPRVVFKGTADVAGGGVIDFPVPADAALGYHLVTIGTDDTALTADCTLRVVETRGEEEGRPPLPPQVFSLLKSHEQLLHQQQRLLSLLAEMIQQVMAGGTLSDDEQAAMVRRYQELLAGQAGLVERFEALIKDRVAP